MGLMDGKKGLILNIANDRSIATHIANNVIEQGATCGFWFLPMENIEKSQAIVWAKDPCRAACERTEYAPGELSKFWPGLIEPHGRIHFAGAYADNLNWGQEAATRSALRVAKAIDAA